MYSVEWFPAGRLAKACKKGALAGWMGKNRERIGLLCSSAGGKEWRHKGRKGDGVIIG